MTQEVLPLNAGATGIVHMFHHIHGKDWYRQSDVYRATPVVRARVKAKTIYQSGFVVQLQCHCQGIGVVVSVKMIVHVVV